MESIFAIDLLDGLEEHSAFVLVEEFGRRVDVVVCSCVGAAYDHDGHGIVVDAVVVDRRFEEVGILAEPFREVQGGEHGGCGSGGW